MDAPKERKKRLRTYRPTFKPGPKVWDPAKAAKSRSYPQSPEAFVEFQERQRVRFREMNAAGLLKRTNIPDGWGGRAKALAAVREKARTEAQQIVEWMKENDVVSPEDARAEEALEYAVAVIRAVDETGKGVESTKARLTAARLVLDFTKQKPTSKIDATVRSAEDFLSDLAVASGLRAT